METSGLYIHQGGQRALWMVLQEGGLSNRSEQDIGRIGSSTSEATRMLSEKLNAPHLIRLFDRCFPLGTNITEVGSF